MCLVRRGVQGPDYSVVDIAFVCTFIPQNEEELCQYQQEVERLLVLPVEVKRSVVAAALANLNKIPESVCIFWSSTERVHRACLAEPRDLESVVVSKARTILLKYLKNES